jgi:hypothetical protein
MIDYTKVTDENVVIELLKERELIEMQIKQLDKMALINYELEKLNESE